MLLSILSTTAIVLGLAGVMPQITEMLRRGSAAGQSALGWSMGMTVNALMGYMNITQYDASVLALGNVAGGALCGIALGIVLRLRERPVHTQDHALCAGCAGHL
ncbi:MAG: hypothetical protein JWO02_54 [Solirubrobacterales bacterium]|nr:hypothetical protein [Solirubrobacterales bacterium]